MFASRMPDDHDQPSHAPFRGVIHVCRATAQCHQARSLHRDLVAAQPEQVQRQFVERCFVRIGAYGPQGRFYRFGYV